MTFSTYLSHLRVKIWEQTWFIFRKNFHEFRLNWFFSFCVYEIFSVSNILSNIASFTIIIGSLSSLNKTIRVFVSDLFGDRFSPVRAERPRGKSFWRQKSLLASLFIWWISHGISMKHRYEIRTKRRYREVNWFKNRSSCDAWI